MTSTGTADDTAAFLAEVQGVLWPGNGAQIRMLALPDVHAPRLLVPARPARVGAAAVRRLAAGRTWRARLRRDTAAALLRVGGARFAPTRFTRSVARGGIADYLSTILDSPCHVAVIVGSPRANRKPVLLALSNDGDPLGYVKIGINDLTRRLVDAEAAALDTLATAPALDLTVPRLLHHGTYRGASMIVQAPLDTRGARAPTLGRLAPAMRSLAATSSAVSPLSEAPAWARIQEKLTALDSDRGAALRTRRDRLEQMAGDTPIHLGAWHGDWTPWNVAVRGPTVAAWDWERYAAGVPRGWDAMHWSIQHSAVVRRLDLDRAARDMLADRVKLVRLVGGDQATSLLVACAYLLEVGARYVSDRQAEYGRDAGVVEDWLLPALDGGLAELEGGRR